MSKSASTTLGIISRSLASRYSNGEGISWRRIRRGLEADEDLRETLVTVGPAALVDRSVADRVEQIVQDIQGGWDNPRREALLELARGDAGVAASEIEYGPESSDDLGGLAEREAGVE